MPPTRAEDYEPVDEEVAARWARFGRAGQANFPGWLGLQVEEVRRGYCRMRLPFRPELKQAAGVVHGGAIAALLDSSLVPAIGVTLPPHAQYATVDLHVQFVDVLVDGDAVAEGWIVRSGRRTLFGESEAREAGTHRLVAKAMMTFSVRLPSP